MGLDDRRERVSRQTRQADPLHKGKILCERSREHSRVA